MNAVGGQRFANNEEEQYQQKAGPREESEIGHGIGWRKLLRHTGAGGPI